MLTIFFMEIQPSNALLVVKIKQHTLKILFDFQMQITRSPGVPAVEFHVIQRHCISLLLSIL